MPNLPQTSSTCAPIVLHMHKKFEVNRTKIKGGCQSYTKAAPKESWNDLTLVTTYLHIRARKSFSKIWTHYILVCCNSPIFFFSIFRNAKLMTSLIQKLKLIVLTVKMALIITLRNRRSFQACRNLSDLDGLERYSMELPLWDQTS